MPSIRWRLMEVDPATWASTDEMPGEVSASVTRDASTPLLESANVVVESAVDAAPRETWARLDALVDGARHAVATMLLVPGPSEVRRGRKRVSYDGYSVLKPAADVQMTAGAYIPAGADGAAEAVRMLSACTPAPVSADGAFTLAEPMVFATKTTYLDAAWMLVDKAGWCIQVDGDGAVHVRPMPTEAAVDVDKGGSRMIGTAVQSDDGLASVPNCYVAVDGRDSATVTDDDPGSPTSTVSRNGRIVQVVDDSPVRVNGESLEQYAKRRLADAMAAIGTRRFVMEWTPGVGLFDVVNGTFPDADLDCRMRVSKQSLTAPGQMDTDTECVVMR